MPGHVACPWEWGIACLKKMRSEGEMEKVKEGSNSGEGMRIKRGNKNETLDAYI